MKKVIILTIICIVCSVNANALTYSKKDSAQVVTILTRGAKQPAGTNMNIFFANQLMSIPYVHATLEVNPQEELAVNLVQLDCTTLVENVLALTLTSKAGSTKFKDFCYWLQRIRYRDGKLDGYASRNHYFTQWINSNTRLGIVTEIQGEKNDNFSPFTATKPIDLHFMTANPSKYPMLRSGDKATIALIDKYEKEASGKTIRYIPRSMLNKGKEVLGKAVHDGDILALVTKKDGLDVSHVGFAVWGKDNRIHLLNASSIHKKVILEPMTLYEYMGKHPSQLGIRVIRCKK